MCLSAASTPSAGGVPAAKVCPLAAVGLPEDNGSSGAQTSYYKGIFRWSGTDKSQRSGGGLHAVCSSDVVFDQNGNAMQRSLGILGAAIEIIGDGLRLGIGLDYGVHFGSRLVGGLNAGEIVLGQTSGGKLAISQASHDRFDSDFVQRAADSAALWGWSLASQPVRQHSGSGGRGHARL